MDVYDPATSNPVIKEGVVLHRNITIQRYSNIEHDPLTVVRAIVLHRTDSLAASSTLSAYGRGQQVGAHFLIDISGQIYQTASLAKVCWHVGILISRCTVENICSLREQERIKSLLYEKGLSFGQRARNLSDHEVQKTYPQRYPSNNDSLGIEVVGKFLPAQKKYQDPTILQVQSTRWIVDFLVAQYHMNKGIDVYAHGAIARKEVSEGSQLLKLIS